MDFIDQSEQISLFCRMNVNTKKNLPIRSSEMGMLIYLVKTNKDTSPIAIAKFFNVSKAMITNMLTSLVKKGYVKKEQSLKDKRSLILIPTEKAIELVEKTYVEYNKNINLLYEQMGQDDFKTFIKLITKANDILLEDKNNG